MHIFNAIIYLKPHGKHSTYKQLQLPPYCALTGVILEHVSPCSYTEQVAANKNPLQVAELKLRDSY